MKRTKPTNHTPAQCKICGHKSPSYAGLATHLRNCHHIGTKEYFDTYIEPFEHKCKHCQEKEAKFINLRLGYTHSCASRECSLKEAKQTKLAKYGDQNYNNRQKFKQTIDANIQADPKWKSKVSQKQAETFAKNVEADPKYWHKRTLKSRATKKDRYGDEFYNGMPQRLETLASKYGVGITNVFQVESIKEKCKQSHLKNLGVEYPSQSKEIRTKIVETWQTNYGVDNPSKLPENRALAKKTTKDRYGDENYRNVEQAKLTNSLKSEEEKKAIVEKREAYNLQHYGVTTPLELHTHRQSISKLSSRIQSIFDANGFREYQMEFKLQFLDELNRPRYRYYDFKIGNTLLEVNGDFYHANPQIYQSDSILRIHHQDIQARVIWEADKFKKTLAENNGFKVVYLWESIMKKLSDSELFTWLKTNVIDQSS